MKKLLISIIIAFVVCSSIVNSVPAAGQELQVSILLSSWTGMIRIEGKNDTVFAGEVTVENSTIYAENASSGEIEVFYFDYPCVLGALDEASILGNFSYHVVYYPDWDAFFIQTIGVDSDWWHYWVDYRLPMVGADQFVLNETHSEILFGYLEDWTARALQISLSEDEVMIHDAVIITVYNETLSPVEDALVIIDSVEYTTDEYGEVVVSISEFGSYMVGAEKDGFVRSEKKVLVVHGPKLTLELGPGGFGLTVQLSNVGDREATEVNWSIVLSGGLTLVPPGGKKTGFIPVLDVSATEILRTLIIGFGRHIITIHAECAEGSEVTITFDGFLIFFFIIAISP